MAEGYRVVGSWGFTSKVYHLPGDPPRICKSFNKDCIETHFPIEQEAYARFSAHHQPSSILKYYGVHDSIPSGIILEFAEKCDIRKYLLDQRQFGKPAPEAAVLCRWALQAAEALEFAHSLGVYNSDIHCINLFLDRDLNLKVGDWAGASIDGSVSHSSYRLRHRLFDTDGTDVPRARGISATTEIFALGTALYWIVTCQEPWPELREIVDREEIKKRIREKQFPDTSMLPALGTIISKCWNVEFTTMTEVKHAIEAHQQVLEASLTSAQN